ncbi:hypothetical protein T01_3219 [Trichinella spiralis]|uniref:Uncharacterized protein n=1 Tax=Trichinella spiralis TaxID=6334 RepID=A0A0V1A5C8_TRISP|nr:hypothetical protein T01_3219 [Trichinella spiralis]
MDAPITRWKKRRSPLEAELIRENSTHLCDWLVADWL